MDEDDRWASATVITRSPSSPVSHCPSAFGPALAAHAV